MRRRSVWNLLRHAARPYAFPVLMEKVKRRFRDRPGSIDAQANARWIEGHVEDAVVWARRRNSDLWNESVAFGEALTERARSELAELPFALSGGGHYVLLYFLTRLLRPECVVETGVAAGYSSSAVLEAMERNETGVLYSSDFPALRLPDPERYIGMLVPARLKSRWKLWTRGDRENLRQIAAVAPPIDLFHYDSDKTYIGRTRAVAAVAPLMAQNSVFVMDDIQDNSFFHDWVSERNVSDFWVFEFKGKYLGVAGSRLRVNEVGEDDG